MTPIYDGQGNHFKRMLELQEKLRKSEEERIRLEERFKLLVQDSRNRHEACINRLRIRYVEFLEEQRARDERNNKLLGALDKVDSSLALMTAKTERLNCLRKQYEAYLLRVYGTQRPNGSVTADSGLESQNDREITPSPIPRYVFSYPNESSIAPVKPSISDIPTTRRTSLLDKSPKARQNILNKFPQSLFETTNDILTNRAVLPSYLDTSWRSLNLPKAEIQRTEINLRSPATIGSDFELDRYLSKIKRQFEGSDHENSMEDPEHEQNTSGDILNVTLSEDGQDSEEEAKKERNRVRELLHTNLKLRVERTRSISEKLKRGEAIDEGDSVLTLLSPSKRNFNYSDVNIKPFAQDQQEKPKFDESMNLDGPRLLIQQNRDLLTSDEAKEENEETKDEADNLSEQEDSKDDGGIEDDYDDTVDIDTWMPDDVEEKVEEVHIRDDIRGMPRRKLESIEEVEQPEDEEKDEDSDEIHDSSADEQVVDEPLDEPQEVQEPTKTEESFQETKQEQAETPSKNYNNGDEYTANQQYYTQDDINQQQYQDHSEYQQIYQQQGDDQQQYQYSTDPNQQYAYDPNAQYAGYDDQQYMAGQYDYSNQQYQQSDPNQAYQHDPNQQYQQGDPNQAYQHDPNQTYQHDPNQTYQHDPNQSYQHDGNQVYQSDPNQQYQHDPNQEYQHDPTQNYQQYSGHEYEGYQETNHGTSNQDPNQNQYDPNQEYDYSQNYVDDEKNEGYKKDSSSTGENNQDEYSEQNFSEPLNDISDNPQKPKAEVNDSKDSPKENKKKKDVIKSILDSDTDSFIERNLSNTESDYDFN